jgi:hypothetical protein
MIKIGSNMNVRRFRMRKSVLYLFAALLVVAFPLSALAGTQVFHVKEQSYPPYVPFYSYVPDPQCVTEVCKIFTCFKYNPNVRNPAYKYGDDVCVSFDATFHENVRVKSNKSGPPDVDWNLVAHGTGYVHPGSVTGGDDNYAVAAAALAAANPIGMYMAYRPANTEVLDSGPLQVEEVVRDDGADAVSEIPSSETPVQLFFGQKIGVSMENLDYAMYHLKIRGNSIMFFRFTLSEGNCCYSDFENGGEICKSPCYPW